MSVYQYLVKLKSCSASIRGMCEYRKKAVAALPATKTAYRPSKHTPHACTPPPLHSYPHRCTCDPRTHTHTQHATHTRAHTHTPLLAPSPRGKRGQAEGGGFWQPGLHRPGPEHAGPDGQQPGGGHCAACSQAGQARQHPQHGRACARAEAAWVERQGGGCMRGRVWRCCVPYAECVCI